MRSAYGKKSILKNIATKRCRISRQAALRVEDRSEKRLKVIKTTTSEVQSLKDQLSVSQKEACNQMIELNVTANTQPSK